MHKMKMKKYLVKYIKPINNILLLKFLFKTLLPIKNNMFRELNQKYIHKMPSTKSNFKTSKLSYTT